LTHLAEVTEDSFMVEPLSKLGPRMKQRLPPEGEAREAALEALFELAFLVAGSDGTVGEPEILLVVEAMWQVTGRPIPPDALATRVKDRTEVLRRDGLEARAKAVASALPQAMRADGLAFAAGVAAADGEVRPEERAVVARLAAALGIPTEDIDRALA
jgi:uncharacterized tellurite resistance protein B-like protein